MAGCGIAFAVPAMMAMAFSGHVAAREGTAAGGLNAIRQTGAALGVALMGSVLDGVSDTALVHALQRAIEVAVVALLTAALAAVLARPGALLEARN